MPSQSGLMQKQRRRVCQMRLHMGVWERIRRHTEVLALLLVCGLVNFNYGLTSAATATATDTISASAMATATAKATASASATLHSIKAKNVMSAELHRNINQNLIMSPASSLSAAASSTSSTADETYDIYAASAAALTATHDADMLSQPYPPSSITATSTLYQQQQQQQQQQQHHSSSSHSGSSITSFDSTNHLIDDRHSEQQQQHSTSHSRIQAKDTATDIHHPMPMHKSMGENHLDGGPSAAAAAGGGGGGGGGADGDDDMYNSPMYFGTENSTVVTTQIGATAHIPCTIHHIGDGVVSWIRKKDYHLLTVGLTTYSSDERFSATHLKHSEDWTLQIKFVQLRDAGVYECQVSTHPPTSIFLHLNVVEARAEISGPPIRYLTPGSTLRLQCRVVQNTEASEFIFWYHDNRMINYDIDRGINVSTEPDFQSSELTILRTRREHSGNFTCVASNTQPASVLVHIFKGDNPAAMYHGHVGSSTKSYQTHLHNIMAIIAIGYRILHTHLHIKIV